MDLPIVHLPLRGGVLGQAYWRLRQASEALLLQGLSDGGDEAERQGPLL